MKKLRIHVLIVWIFLLYLGQSHAQQINWAKDGNSYYQIDANEIVRYTLPDNKRNMVVSSNMLSPAKGNP